jgi:hypothetical protein
MIASRIWTFAAMIAMAGGCHDAAQMAAPDLGTPYVAPMPKTKVDVLFMVDNSLSTSPFQDELRKRFPQLIKTLDDAAIQGHPASYHFGVVSSDLGSGTNMTACKPGGDGGRLSVGPSSASMNVPANCAGFTLGGGVRFLDYNQLTNTNNVGGGLSVPDAFNCISMVGNSGCGFEQPLESVYRALHDAVLGNEGFLRPDAVLVVLFVADEDDCSAPADTDLFEPSPANYGTLHSFRCTKWGITCSDPPRPLQDSDAGPLTNCRPLTMAEGGKLFDVQRYIDFFTKPATIGGVKENPADVIVASIVGPPQPFAVQITAPCADQINTPSCPILQHSCLGPANPNFFADPAVRIAAVVNATRDPQQTSLCDANDSSALDALAQRIIARLQ